MEKSLDTESIRLEMNIPVRYENIELILVSFGHKRMIEGEETYAWATVSIHDMTDQSTSNISLSRNTGADTEGKYYKLLGKAEWGIYEIQLTEFHYEENIVIAIKKS